MLFKKIKTTCFHTLLNDRCLHQLWLYLSVFYSHSYFYFPLPQPVMEKQPGSPLLHCHAAFFWCNNTRSQRCGHSSVKPTAHINGFPEISALDHISIRQTPSYQALFILCTAHAKEQLRTCDVSQLCYST